MSRDMPRSPGFFARLRDLDKHVAEKARVGRCPVCGGRLDVRNYPRKPRGGPENPGPDDCMRLSFCCAAEGCRKSVTPFSVRFLGRKVYFGIVVVLVSALTHGVTWKRAEEIRQTIGVDARTLRNWRKWWLSEFRESRFWKAGQGRFSPPVDPEALPHSLWSRFAGEGRDDLVSLMRFLSPITSETAPGCQPV